MAKRARPYGGGVGDVNATKKGSISRGYHTTWKSNDSILRIKIERKAIEVAFTDNANQNSTKKYMRSADRHSAALLSSSPL